MKYGTAAISLILILSLFGCATPPGTFSVSSNNPASQIFIEGELEGTGRVNSYTTSDEDLKVVIRTPDYDEYAGTIVPDYVSEDDRVNRDPNYYSDSGTIMGITGLFGGLALYMGFMFPLFEEDMTQEDTDFQSALFASGGGLLAVTLGFIIDYFQPKPVWKTSYSFDVASLSHFDSQGYNKKTGFNKYGVNRNGVFEDGSSFSGRVVNGKKQGYGVWKTAEGDTHTGTFSADKPGGFIISRYRDGSAYYGYWSAGKQNGPGVAVAKDGSETLQKWYNGEKLSSEPHKAAITGSRFDWVFLSNSGRNGLAEGSGNAVTRDGGVRIENGRFESGKLAEGSMIFSDGTKYDGRFNADLLLEGSITYPDGRVYEGELKNGVPDGKGKMTFRDGTTYTGDFRNGSYNGEGKIVKSNGESFEGSFLNGKPHGSGIFFKDGRVERCEYYQGERIDQAYLIRMENERQLEAMREERILIAKERENREEQQRLERERQEAARKKREAQAEDDSFFGALLVGGATALIGGSMGLDAGTLAAASVGAGIDAYRGDESMSTMKGALDASSGGRTNLSGSSSGSSNSSGSMSAGNLTGIRWRDIPGKTDLYFESSSRGRLVMLDLDGSGATMTTYFNISSIDYNGGTMTYSVDYSDMESAVYGKQHKEGDGQSFTAPFRIEGNMLYWDNRTFTR